MVVEPLGKKVIGLPFLLLFHIGPHQALSFSVPSLLVLTWSPTASLFLCISPAGGAGCQAWWQWGQVSPLTGRPSHLPSWSYCCWLRTLGCSTAQPTWSSPSWMTMTTGPPLALPPSPSICWRTAHQVRRGRPQAPAPRQELAGGLWGLEAEVTSSGEKDGQQGGWRGSQETQVPLTSLLGPTASCLQNEIIKVCSVRVTGWKNWLFENQNQTWLGR